MKFLTKLIFLKLLVLLNLAFSNISFADNHNIYETLEIIKNDIKTLERAVYSGSIEVKAENNETSNTELDSNSEDVLTRHLLKLSEVEDQFRQLTNKFEEINFKLDKLSNRLSKIQADNQIRFHAGQIRPQTHAPRRCTSTCTPFCVLTHLFACSDFGDIDVRASRWHSGHSHCSSCACGRTHVRTHIRTDVATQIRTHARTHIHFKCICC